MDRIASALLGIICTGCAHVYNAQLDGPTAEIRFIARSTAATAVAAFSDDKCGVSGGAGRVVILGGAISPSIQALKHQSLGMLGNDGLDLQDFHEMKIAAGKSSAYVFRTSDFAGTSCDAALAFTPERDRQYEVVFRVEQFGCKATVTMLVPNNGRVVRIKQDSKRLACSYPGNF
jgi:hypothetical protein